MRVLVAGVLISLSVSGCAAGVTTAGSSGASGSSALPGSSSSSGAGSGSVVPNPPGTGTAPGSAAPGTGTVTSGSAAPGMPGVPSGPMSVGCRLGPDAGPAAVAGARPVPAGVHVVAVRRCVIRTAPGAAVSVQVTQRAATEAAALVAALRLPSLPKRGQLCPMYAMVVPYFDLVLADGSVLVPTLPTTGCGQPRQEVLTALAALRFVDVSARPLR